MPKVLVVHTKLTPPRLPRRVLQRPRLTTRLLEALDYRLTILQAGTGYGKSTALATLADAAIPLAWYHLDNEDSDPSVFLMHLFYSLHRALPALPETVLAVLEGVESGVAAPWAAFVDALVNALAQHTAAPVLLVLDDVHRLRAAPDVLTLLNRFIERAPAHLHTIFATRHPLELPSLLTWQVKGQVLPISQHELAFTAQEISALFHEHYGITLPEDEAVRLAAQTEGWAIALQLVWQGLRSGAVATVPQALGRLSGPGDQLFAYLAQEILLQQSGEIRQFLELTAVLREMTAELCDCLRGAMDSAAILRSLLESGLFVVDLGNGHSRYHHLFRQFLRESLPLPERREAHRRAAACFQRVGDPEERLYHLLRAAAYPEAADVLDELGQTLVRSGQLERLAAWINSLPPAVLEARPRLLAYLGDVARLHSRFDEALGWYRQAEHRARLNGDLGGIGQALRGQARIYLDTVNPSQAESILQEALRLSDGLEDRESRANLLELMAENRLNLGRPDEAEQLRAQALALREEGPGEAELSVRVLLRTGQLEQARRLLEKRVLAEQREPVLRPRAHRETLLLLALILVFQGEAETAYQYAIQGTERGQQLNSPFVTAVGYMRQGHAWLLRDPVAGYEEACRCYREAIRISDTLAVPRLKVEAYWGLCRAHGFRGALDAAERAAAQGLALAEPAGDTWIAALIRLSLGASYALAKKYPAAGDWLALAWAGFYECGDAHGQTATRLWQSLVWWALDDHTRLERSVEQLCALARENRYEHFFLQQTLQGPPDPRRLAPLLLFARDKGLERVYAESLLARLGLAQTELHPGYQLRVQTLGAFRVWRGAEEIPATEWRRESSRQLFQVLLTHRAQLLERDQIVELLWPDLDPETSVRDFKVALSTLFKTLEPERKANAPSAFIAREGTLYGLRPHADLAFDVAAFEQHIRAGDAKVPRAPHEALARYRQALALYQGDYLQEYPYAEWCTEERDRLRTLYLRTADRAAQLLAEQGQWAEIIPITETMLARDNCWEAAYRLLMMAYTRLGNRPQALRVYQRCVECLRAELDVAPSDETEEVHASIAGE